MKRTLMYMVAISLLASATLFLPNASSSTCGDNASLPPFMATGVKPNILIILDNSGSMVQDFYGAAAGGWSPASKTVIAEDQLRNIIEELKNKARIGLMTFDLPSVSQNNLDNSYYFVSYDDRSYCPDPDDDTAAACQAYCLNPSDSNAKQKCYDGCSKGNASFTTDFTDAILGYGASASTRATYCPIIYPKTVSDTLKGRTFYYKKGPYQKYGYDTRSGFLWSGSHDYWMGDVQRSSYQAYSNKTDSRDDFSGYANYQVTYSSDNYIKQLTETDTAMGFRDFGNRMVYQYIGPTWSGGVGPWPYGFLHVSVDDLLNDNLIQTTTYSSLLSLLTPKTDSSGYMSCSQWDKNRCSYIVSAGGTPTYGALKAALDYFKGDYDGPSGVPSNAGTSPITSRCQKNYIILVTDGLPSVNKRGYASLDTEANTDEVVNLLSNSRCFDSSTGQFNRQSCDITKGNADCLTQHGGYNTCMPVDSTVIKSFPDPDKHNQTQNYAFPVKTFVLGMGLIDTAKQNLNDMAAAGGTGKAYFADDPSQMKDALDNIITNILGQAASGTAVSVLADQTQMGANMLQAIFYPSKYFGTTELAWPGYLYNHWFYVSSSPGLCSNGTGSYSSQICHKDSDCAGTNYSRCDTDMNGICYDSAKVHNTNQACSSDTDCTTPGYPTCVTTGMAFTNNIREDTVHDYILNLRDDYGLTFAFDTITGVQVNRTEDSTGSGSPNVYVDTTDLDHIKPIWEAGKLLFETPASARTIYTVKSSSTDQYGGSLTPFDSSIASSAALAPLLGEPANFDACLQVPGADSDGLSDQNTRENLIDYVRGVDNYYCYNPTASVTADPYSSYSSTACDPNHGNADCSGSAPYTVCKAKCRNRTVGLCYDGTDYSNQGCEKDSDCATGTCSKHVWKLGDIIYSTPRVALNYSYCAKSESYCYDSTDSVYSGTACNPQNGNNDCTTDPYTICRTKSSSFDTSMPCSSNADCSGSTDYPACQPMESVIFAGANDGMLHAFKTGIETDQGVDPSKNEVERIVGLPTEDMGKELWSFIPKNSLPYLRCLAAPPPNSCHLYYSDLSPYITDMISDGKVRKILIGGMRLGGATWYSKKFCFNSSGQTDGTACQNTNDCPGGYNNLCEKAFHTTAPADTCAPVTRAAKPTDASGCTGLSSYYALDVTDAEHPKFLWEFSNPRLGYSFSGPAVIHRPGGYYVMFLSGPNVPGDGSVAPTGQSTQNMAIFVLTLNDDLTIKSIYVKDFSNAQGNIAPNGFGGRLFTNGLDVSDPPDGYTDFVLFGYSYSPSGAADDWKGGIAKVYTGDPDPSKWDYDVNNYFNISQAPVTAKVEAMKCFDGEPGGGWWIYAGSGRYFYHDDNYGPSSDGSASQGNAGHDFLLGAQFTCDDQNNCKSNINYGHDQSDVCQELTGGGGNPAAWMIDLNLDEDGYLNERNITDPTVTSSNMIFFTTTEPTNDPCGYGGRTRLWGMNCATAEAISNQTCNSAYNVDDTAVSIYLQTSTGAIAKVDPNTSMTKSGAGIAGRTSDWTPGIPPQESSQPISPTKPVSGATNRWGKIIQWIEK